MDADSHQQAQAWAGEIAVQVLDWAWRAFDSLHALGRIDLNQSLEQLERDLTSHHFREIQRLWKLETEGFSAFCPHHEWSEMATRSPAPAKPPAYDLAFVWNENPRVAWPIEAKVVATTSSLAEYVADTAKFTNGTAAPFVGEGAQIAYLLSGVAAEFFANVSKRLAFKLKSPPEFTSRATLERLLPIYAFTTWPCCAVARRHRYCCLVSKLPTLLNSNRFMPGLFDPLAIRDLTRLRTGYGAAGVFPGFA